MERLLRPEEYEEGMKVRIIYKCSGAVPGRVYTLKRNKRCNNDLFAWAIYSDGEEDFTCSDCDNWLFVEDKIENWKEAIENGIYN